MFTARRPFHPLRLHAALDLLLDGWCAPGAGSGWPAAPMTSCGSSRRRWSSVQLRWKMAGGNGFQRTRVCRSAAAGDGRHRWDDPVRRPALVTDGAGVRCRPGDIVDGLRGALLTGDELCRPDEWPGYPDPFGDWHEEPCDELSPDEPADPWQAHAKEKTR